VIAVHWVARIAARVAVALASTASAVAEPTATAGEPNCAVAPALSAIEPALERSASRIEAGKPLTIVAIGSSSTRGTGASSPAMSYPSRLEQELKARFPKTEIRVINHGVGGQDVPEELFRLGRDVMAENPDLVVWQVGTNAVLRRDDLSEDERLIERGVALMKESGIDIVLMDMQYAPRVLARPAGAEMERLIADIARRAHVALFHRFEVMQEWDRTGQLAPAAMIGPDGLHMTDASYRCLANQLAEGLMWNWRSRAKLAASSHRRPDSMAGPDRASQGPSRATSPSRE
jgi:acyl-CoA thioesterase-1